MRVVMAAALKMGENNEMMDPMRGGLGWSRGGSKVGKSPQKADCLLMPIHR